MVKMYQLKMRDNKITQKTKIQLYAALNTNNKSQQTKNLKRL